MINFLAAFAVRDDGALADPNNLMNSSLLNLTSLELALRVAALAQFAVAILNLFLIRIMKWKPDLERAPLIIREVFRIHVVFISITLSIFGAADLAVRL